MAIREAAEAGLHPDWSVVTGDPKPGDVWFCGDGLRQPWKPGSVGAPAGKWAAKADILLRPRDRRGPAADYATPEMVARRNSMETSVCVDFECDLSGGYAHVGPCEPCECGKRHAIEECPALLKALFLDFDGTMNGLETREPPSSIHKGIFLNPVLVERVNRICEATGAKVVLSCSWRHRLHDDGRPITLGDLQRALARAGLTAQVIGSTPDMRPPGSAPKAVYTPRAHEIQAWIDTNKPGRFVVLDDYTDAAIGENFVHCDRRVGLTEEGAREAIRILSVRTAHPSPASAA